MDSSKLQIDSAVLTSARINRQKEPHLGGGDSHKDRQRASLSNWKRNFLALGLAFGALYGSLAFAYGGFGPRLTPNTLAQIRIVEDYNVPTTGRSFYLNGQPIIAINPRLIPFSLQGSDRHAFIRFIIAHEKAHFLLRHFNQYNQQLVPLVQAEFDADCWAAQTLQGAGDMHAVRVAHRLYESLGSRSGYPGSPSGSDHARAIQNCVK